VTDGVLLGMKVGVADGVLLGMKVGVADGVLLGMNVGDLVGATHSWRLVWLRKKVINEVIEHKPGG
jgi:hypothetical protein